jgi:hypothetical protein
MQYEIAVNDCLFGPDGTVLLFRCADGTVRLYDIPQQLPDNSAFINAWARARSGLDYKREPPQLSQADWLAAQKEVATLEKSR